MQDLLQSIFYAVSPLVTLLAVSVAYIALVKQSRPHIIIQYRPNPNVQSIIDLVIENIGGGMARHVNFSKPLPVNYFGIEQSTGDGKDVLGEGLPALAAGQQVIFDGGQFGGLSEKLQEPLEIKVSYEYKNPLGIRRKQSDSCVLSVGHLRHMPTRDSADKVMVDALKGTNRTTLKDIYSELRKIGASLEELNKILNSGDSSDQE